MTAGSGRTTVTSLSCNGDQQWIDSQLTVYTSAHLYMPAIDYLNLSDSNHACPGKCFECKCRRLLYAGHGL
ncbi:unnamed protein product [Strongylus vulgaris]|uniref:Uncharacterized protein n=1 Tax=Strongylus vulgaris TaxID=40348 RepID=A0A3P7IV72_STRVU|nr:unnamed protein product [Strongylus vulgaris]